MEIIPSTRQQQPYAPTPGFSLKRLVVAGLALVCTTMAAIGTFGMTSSHFQHDHARLLEQIANAHAVKISIHPRNGSKLLTNNVTVHITLFPKAANHSDLHTMNFDAKVFYQFAKQLYNFTLIDDKGFWSIQEAETRRIVSQECLLQDNIPPIQTFRDSLINARVVDHVKDFDVKCEDGKLVEFMFANEPFVFCSRPNGTAVNTVHGEDFHMSLEFLQAHSEGAPSRDILTVPQGFALDQCEPLTTTPMASSDDDSGRRLVAKHYQFVKRRAADIVHVATGQPRVAQLDPSTCDSCPNGKKACLFVHGLGSPIYEGLLRVYAYWGNIEQYTPCCSSIRFIRMNTIDNEWYGANLTTEMCNAAKTMVPNASDPMQLENLVLVTHSMGNLIAASAMIQNKCGLGASSKWIASSPPLKGSMSATLGLSICTQERNPIRSILAKLGFCPAHGALKSLAFKGSLGSTAELDQKLEEVVTMFRSRVDAQLCGVSKVGLMSVKSIIMSAAGTFSGHLSKENDGVVEIGSCMEGFDAAKAQFSTSWRDGAFYKAQINHADAQFRNGDGFWGDSRKPLKWLQCQLQG